MSSRGSLLVVAAAAELVMLAVAAVPSEAVIDAAVPVAVPVAEASVAEEPVAVAEAEAEAEADPATDPALDAAVPVETGTLDIGVVVAADGSPP